MKTHIYPFVLFVLSILALASVARAQLTPDQKELDFAAMIAAFDRYYAPIGLISDDQGSYILNANWLKLARTTRSDAQFHELTLKYLASFGHSHDMVALLSDFQARLGFTVNFYDGVLLIDSIDRRALPAAPFQIGDQLVEVDGRNVAQWLAIYIPLVAARNISIRQTRAANLIVWRNLLLPFSPEPGQTAQVKVRHQNGNVAQYTLRWLTQGASISQFAPVPLLMQVEPELPKQPFFVARSMPSGTLPAVGVGERDPIFQLPSGFQKRLGSSPTDDFFSGIYQAGGHTIGFLRIGYFAAPDSNLALAQLAAEVHYLNQHTDGLVLDVTRNPGGDADFQDAVAQLFFTQPFKTLPEQIRPSLLLLESVSNALTYYGRTSPPDPALIDHLNQFYQELSSASEQGQRLTPPLYPRNLSPYLQPAKDPAGNVIAYSKPILLLVDENTACGAEAFAAVFQDNRRGRVAGQTTQGAGGMIQQQLPAGPLSERSVTLTTTLFVRTQLAGGGGPAYIEYVGVKPDASLNYMTKANLTGGGAPFVNGFTKLILNQLR